MTIGRLGQAALTACMLMLASGAQATTKAEYQAAKERADADYKAADAKCANLAGNPKDICKAEATAERKKATAGAKADYENTDSAREDAAKTAADADYDVAKQRCDAKTGNEKDVCVKEAKAAKTRALADAKARGKSRSARADAAKDKVDADYKVAMEKCDGLAGNAKDDCQKSAKARYHQ